MLNLLLPNDAFRNIESQKHGVFIYVETRIQRRRIRSIKLTLLIQSDFDTLLNMFE